MKKIQPKKEITKSVFTNDVHDISRYLLKGEEIEQEVAEGGVIDNLTLSPYLWNMDKTVIAQYNNQVGAVGFYKEVGANVKRLKHLDVAEAANTSPFKIKKTEKIDLLRDELPSGDIIIQYEEQYYSSISIAETRIEADTLGEYSAQDYISLFLDGGWKDVLAIYYTGLSTGENEIVEVDFSEFL